LYLLIIEFHLLVKML